MLNPAVNFYFTKAKKWKDEVNLMRQLALESKLKEELKWGCPCYTLPTGNIVLIHVFKEYCAFLFFKGAIMKDPKKLLVQQSPNVQAARQIRFTSSEEIIKLTPHLKKYIQQAIQIEQAGLKVSLKKTAEFNMPDEFKSKIEAFKELNTAFYALSPGRQRAYLLFFSAPKQTKTREARIEKSIPSILDGKGLND